MKNTANNFIKLYNEYAELKDEIMDYNDNLHDSMYWDLEGYYSEMMTMKNFLMTYTTK